MGRTGRIAAVVAAALASVAMLGGCGADKAVGTWETSNGWYSVSIDAGGTYSYMDIHERDKSSKGTWQNDGGTYVFTDA